MAVWALKTTALLVKQFATEILKVVHGFPSILSKIILVTFSVETTLKSDPSPYQSISDPITVTFWTPSPLVNQEPFEAEK